jgi:YfiH family protein
MILRTCNGAAFYQFEHLASYEEITHGIFLRTAGFSGAPFHRLNVSFAVGDRPEAVRRNRQLVADCMGGAGLFFARQVHGADVLVVDDRSLAAGGSGPEPVPEGDAFVSVQPGVRLAVKVADCQPILLYDPQRRVVANVHAGWRGSIANVAGRTVALMTRRFGSAAGDILAGIGPSLGPCCAEFVNYRREIPRAYWGYRRDRNHFDFWQISRDQLLDAGLAPVHIQTSGWCTRCHTGRFFSYRGEKRTGRFPAVIGIRCGDDPR